jgi:parallel beta-helix repeat protein
MLAGLSLKANGPAAEPPPLNAPRATSGDARVEPDWAERLTVTVGLEKADIIGSDQRAIQAAVDYVARLGGGTVKVLAGTYHLRNAVFLQTKVRLLGEGEKTILFKEPSATTKLAADSDWFDQEITLEDASSFRLGDGVCLRTEREGGGGEIVLKRTLVARTGNRFKLDRALRENFWRVNNATVSSLFPIVSGENISDVAIENITLDGNREHNANLDGNYAGCIFLQDCERITIRGVTARNYNGDGISWQICHDVLVENCVSEHHTGLGLHPGSGSQRPVIRNNRLANNHIGLFFCWGVRHGLAENNRVENNDIGISIGHHDTDNLVTNNDVSGSKTNGILFRAERGPDFTGNRNRIVGNTLLNNGAENGAAIEVKGGTRDVTLENNQITDSRGASRRVAILLGPETQNVLSEGNTIQGFAKEVEQTKKP